MCPSFSMEKRIWLFRRRYDILIDIRNPAQTQKRPDKYAAQFNALAEQY